MDRMAEILEIHKLKALYFRLMDEKRWDEWAEVFMHRSMGDFKRFMDESGLSPSQVSTLMHLHYGRQCGVSDIGQHLGVTHSSA